MRADEPRRGNGLALLVASTALLPWAAAWLPAGRWWLPFALVAAVFPEFARRVRAGDVAKAWRWGMAWAFCLSASTVILTLWHPQRAEVTVLQGTEYRDEMFHWIETGEGKEGDPARFLPEHALHLAAFVVLCWTTGGLGGLALGAILTGYMSFFVGSFAAAARSPWAGSVVAWFPWSVARVSAFVLAGVLLARPLLTRKLWPWTRADLRWFAWIAAGLAVDVVLKTLLAPSYGRWFARWFGE